jgi:hypothetical protein
MAMRAGLLIPIILTAACGGGGGGGGPAQISATVNPMPMHVAVAAGDIDIDALTDIVSISNTIDPRESHLNIYAQRTGGPGSFAPAERILVGTNPRRQVHEITLADIDRDGELDIVVTHLGRSVAGSPEQGDEISVLRQNRAEAGQFLAAVSYSVGNLPHDVAIGDLDLDGLPDIVSSTGDGVYLLRQSGSSPGQFLDAIQVTTEWTDNVVIGDLNNDGLPDIAYTLPGQVAILLNNPAAIGSFRTGPVVDAGGSPGDLVVVDLDGDSRLDIATANHESSSGNSGGLSILLQDTVIDASFPSLVEIEIEDAFDVVSITAADLNGDSHPDVVCALSPFAGANVGVAVYLQKSTGGGTFDPADFYPAPTNNAGPMQATVANLGPDTFPDIVLANGLDGVYALYQQASGVGTFGRASRIGE